MPRRLAKECGDQTRHGPPSLYDLSPSNGMGIGTAIQRPEWQCLTLRLLDQLPATAQHASSQNGSASSPLASIFQELVCSSANSPVEMPPHVMTPSRMPGAASTGTTPCTWSASPAPDRLTTPHTVISSPLLQRAKHATSCLAGLPVTTPTNRSDARSILSNRFPPPKLDIAFI